VVLVSRVKTVSTRDDNQTAVKLCIFQGENRLVKYNIYLGELEVPVPPRRSGEVRIEVRFTHDNNGLLVAEAHVPRSGARLSLVIEHNPGVLSPEEIKQRLEALSALKMHLRDQQVNSVLMARLERLCVSAPAAWRRIFSERSTARMNASSVMPASRWLSGWIVSNDASETRHEI